MPVWIFKLVDRSAADSWDKTISGPRPASGAVKLLLLVVLLLAGCSSRPSETWSGPSSAATTSLEPWRFQRHDGHRLRTPHYLIYTTIDDERTRDRLGQVMEGALLQYRRFAPATPLADGPMECYFFATRGQWNAFTRRHAGPAASVYLQITRGGYAIGDRYVAYYIGQAATWSVAAHEGWHQYVARHFRGRLPPFLEEGIACLFEHVHWEDDLPRWNLSLNPSRAHSLRRTLDGRHQWPLEKLIAMHAGDVVGEPPQRIEAWYAQSWAFAYFLLEAENGRYRPGLRRLLRETATGTVHDPSGTHRSARVPWDPSAVRPLLEHYLQTDFAALDRAYEQWIQELAQRRFHRQWR